MSIPHGKYASVTFRAQAIPFVTQWTCTINQTTADSTAMDASNFGRTRKPGFKSGTATITAWMTEGAWVDDDAALIDDGDEGALVLSRGASAGAGGYTIASARVTGRTATDPKDGVVGVTYNLIANGAIAALS